MASQQEMKVTICGQQIDFLVIQPLEPGAILTNPMRLNRTLPRRVPVELDTRPKLKFQVLQGGLPNDFVFANDRKILLVRSSRAANPVAEIPCEPIVTTRPL
jgi:hypothetical protein